MGALCDSKPLEGSRIFLGVTLTRVELSGSSNTSTSWTLHPPAPAWIFSRFGKIVEVLGFEPSECLSEASGKAHML